jgi:hypothetical protein
MGSVEMNLCNTRIALHPRCLLQMLSKVLRNFPENCKLALDDLLVPAIRQMARDIPDKTLSSFVVEHLLPQCAGCIEVLESDLGEIGDRFADPVRVVDFGSID